MNIITALTLLSLTLPCASVSQALATPLSTAYSEAVLADDPVDYWTFNDPFGTATATNLGSMGAALNGFYVDVQLEQTAAFPRLGTAIAFDQSTSVVNLSSDLGTWLNQTGSLEFWIKTSQVGSGTWQAPALTGADHNGTGRDLFWGTNSGGRMGMRRGDQSHVALTPEPINDDIWHHLVLTRDHRTGIMQVFLDGDTTPVGTYDDTDNLSISTLGRVRPVPGPAQKFNALIDEVAVYDYVLTGDEVQTHYLAAVPEPTSLTLTVLGLFGLVARGRRRGADIACRFRR